MRLVLALVCLTAAGAAALTAGRVAFGRLALDLGAPKLALPLLADPHARGFYERMGFTGFTASPSASIPGRELPRLYRAL